MNTATKNATASSKLEWNRSIWPDVSLVSVALIWGVNIPLMKLGLNQLDNVFVFNAIRLTISAFSLGAVAIAERRRGILPKPGIRFRQLLLYSMMVGALYQLCFLIGMDYTTPGNTALIIATVPIWTTLLATVFLRETVGLIGWSGLIIAVVGTIIVAVPKGVSASADHFWGNLVILGSAILWAAGTVYSRPMLNKISPVQLAAVSSALSLPVHIGVATTWYSGSLAPLQSLPLWLILVYSGVLSSGLSQPMWHFGVRHAGASHASIIQNLIPVFAMLAAWVIAREIPTSSQVFGGSLILLGLVTMRYERFRGAARTET